MRIRTARFVMIPMWVMTHPEVRGDATRIAVYAGIRAVAWEAPDMEWRSTREIAAAVAEVTGIGSEACRKHLSALVRIGAIIRTEWEVMIPDDDPMLGTAVGTTVPNPGSAGTQTVDHTSTSEREKKEVIPLGTSRTRRDQPEHDQFGVFYEQYPRKKDRRAASRAFTAAVKRAGSVEAILTGLEREVTGWRRAGRHATVIPYPATWLNADGWLNEPDQADPRAGGSAVARQRIGEQRGEEAAAALERGDAATAWEIILERADADEALHWWRRADHLIGLTDSEIATVLSVEEPDVAQWRAMRERVMSGGARELTA